MTTKPCRTVVVVLGLAGIMLAGACSSTEKTSSGASTTASVAPKAKTFGADPANQPAGDASKAGYSPTGKLIADSGFRPEKDGFGFENYGSAPPGAPPRPNLTPEDVRKLFGDGVCGDLAGGKCDLVPAAGAWMDKTNKDMSGGHCYGFSVASELLWQQKEQATAYGGETPPALKIDDNAPLARQLAYTWAFQTLDKVQAGQVQGTPVDILGKLQEVLVPNPAETYTVAIFKADGTGGHAVTPYAIEDRGDGTYSVLIYDNNWPGLTRQLTIDKNANTWTYVAATNPAEPSEAYKGDATTKSLSLFPTSPGLGTQPCPFCGKVPAASGAPVGTAGPVGSASDKASSMDEIYLDGSDTDHGHLLITDGAGRQLGYVNGAFVNQIPGARVERSLSSQDWKESIEPTYYVPDGATYTVIVDGSGLKETDPTSVGIIGPSFELSVDDIQLAPGEKDTLIAAPDATKLSYTTTRAESPKIELGVSDESADYVFDLSGKTVQAGSTVNLSLPAESSDLTIDTAGAPGSSTFNLSMTREDDQAKLEFTHDGIALTGSDSAVLQFGKWTSNGDSIPLVITHDGTQRTETLSDGG